MSGYSAIPDSGDTSVQVDDSAKRSPVKVVRLRLAVLGRLTFPVLFPFFFPRSSVLRWESPS